MMSLLETIANDIVNELFGEFDANPEVDRMVVKAKDLRKGNVVLEWNERGKRKTHVIESRDFTAMCRKVHVKTAGGQNWCYEPEADVWVLAR